MGNKLLTVLSTLNSPIEVVWKYWTTPEDIVIWNNASEDWHTTKAENDFRAGGIFNSRMESIDGSMGFDFTGKYDLIKTHELIEFTMDDGRKVKINFSREGNKTRIVESFEAESTNSLELQQSGWQAILDNFKKYTESKKNNQS